VDTFNPLLLHSQGDTPKYAIFFYFFIFLNMCGGTLDTEATTGPLYQPWMVGDGNCGEIGGMKIVRGNRSTWRKPARV
jgi:hypothetical protein